MIAVGVLSISGREDQCVTRRIEKRGYNHSPTSGSLCCKQEQSPISSTMATQMVKAVAEVVDVTDQRGIRTFVIDFPKGFCTDLEVGASIATVCA